LEPAPRTRGDRMGWRISTNTIRSLRRHRHRRRSKLGMSAIICFFSLRAVGHHGLAWKTPPAVALISAVQARSDVRQVPRGWTVSKIPSTPCVREKRRLRFTPRRAGPPPLSEGPLLPPRSSAGCLVACYLLHPVRRAHAPAQPWLAVHQW